MWQLLLLVVCACGRIGFDARLATGDGGGDARRDATGDGSTVAWSHLTAYADQTCALRGGLAYCWGSNSNGQIGIGSMTNAPVPVPVALPAGSVHDIAQGETHACAIVGGNVYCWGSTTGTLSPMAMGIPGDAVTAGRDFTCVLAAGAVSCWGANGAGQLCVGDAGTHTSPTSTLLGPGVTAIRAGDDHVCATVPGKAQCCGHNDYGTLGTGSTSPSSTSSPLDVATVSALPLIAGWHACALVNGGAWCWGEGDNGELGDGGSTSTPTPQPVPSLASSIAALATGGGPTDRDASCAISGAGAVACWGNGLYGRLGQGAANPSNVPVAVVGLPPSVAATSVAIGYDHACALLANDTIWCWGRGDLGQLGDGKMLSSLAPVQVVTP